jgi:hypothetical protein
MSIGTKGPPVNASSLTSWFGPCSLPSAMPAAKAARKLLPITTLAVLPLLAARGARGQSAAFATIAGRVLDPQGASVSRATVTATNVETGLVRKTNSTEDGLYQFDHLTPGIYDVRVEGGSFARAAAKNLKLQVGERRDVNFDLLAAGRAESLVVRAETPLIQGDQDRCLHGDSTTEMWPICLQQPPIRTSSA